MSLQAVALTARPALPRAWSFDPWLLFGVLTLMGVGAVMVGSASVAIAERQYGQPLYFFFRQLGFCGVAAMGGAVLLAVPLRAWERFGPWLLLGSLVLCSLVLLPGVGREVNGSARWLPLGPFSLQPSELLKLGLVLFLAGYLVRRNEEVRTRFSGFLKPAVILASAAALLLLEPDFGATAVMVATALGMMFLGGVRLWQFVMVLALAGLALAVVALSSPYRLQRLTTFLDPWSDQFDSGYQLTQALIAFGRGEWFGAGLGGGVQKLFYLPEAHTDFLFAVVAEELGLVGAVAVLLMFALVVWRIFIVARCAAEHQVWFAAYYAYGIGILLALQAIISVGVNTGLLPTKGLTLPLLSYGGSSLVVTVAGLAVVLRADYELRCLSDDGPDRQVERRNAA